MKKKLFILLFIVSMLTLGAKAQTSLPWATYTPTFPTSQRNIPYIVLDDDVYTAIVEYESHTGHRATYKLNVVVRNDVVVAIDFGNGGSVHAGRNNSGYTYRGGGIEYQTDYQGNIQSSVARIQVNYSSGGWQYFIVHF